MKIFDSLEIVDHESPWNPIGRFNGKYFRFIKFRRSPPIGESVQALVKKNFIKYDDVANADFVAIPVVQKIVNGTVNYRSI